MVNLNEKLKQIRVESGFVKVVHERMVSYVVTHAKAYVDAPVVGHMLPFLDDYDAVDDLFLALPTGWSPEDDPVYNTFPLQSVSEPDLPKLVPGAKFWHVVSLEDNRCGTRQRCWRLIFEE